jgi:anthranilate synthase component 1
MDTDITIRTVVIKDGAATVQAGAGIVADSEPASEYAESRHKANALLSAISLAEQIEQDENMKQGAPEKDEVAI